MTTAKRNRKVTAAMAVSPSLLSLDEVARRIAAHLYAFEKNPKTNRMVHGLAQYFNVHAYRAGAYVSVTYISYQGPSKLRRADAVEYLQWLDAGNVGAHWDCREAHGRGRGEALP